MMAKSFTLLCITPLLSQSLILYKHIMALAEHRATNDTQFSEMLTQIDRQLISKKNPLPNFVQGYIKDVSIIPETDPQQID